MEIPELRYIERYASTQAEADLLTAVDAEPWLADLKRRVQHYGYRYDYKARKVDPSMYLGPLPVWAQPIATRLVADGYMTVAPDQLIVNEYEPGQGITAHVDCVRCFGPVVCSVTLGSPCVMELSAVEGNVVELLLLERGSLVVGRRRSLQVAPRNTVPEVRQDRWSDYAARTARVPDLSHGYRRKVSHQAEPRRCTSERPASRFRPLRM